MCEIMFAYLTLELLYLIRRGGSIPIRPSLSSEIADINPNVVSTTIIFEFEYATFYFTII